VAEVAGGRFAIASETVVVELFFDDVTGEPTRVTSSNDGAATLARFTLANGAKVFSTTREIPAGSSEYVVPANLAHRIDFLSGDVFVEVEHAT